MIVGLIIQFILAFACAPIHATTLHDHQPQHPQELQANSKLIERTSTHIHTDSEHPYPLKEKDKQHRSTKRGIRKLVLYSGGENPSAVISQRSRRLSSCEDRIVGKFMITKPDGTQLIRSCTWVRNNIERRCSFDGVASQCPRTCSLCTEMPSISPSIEPTTMPSQAPTGKPSFTRPPVDVEATVSMKLGPVRGKGNEKKMSESNREFLQDTIDATLTNLFMSATPQIENIKTTVINEAVVKQISRRLSSVPRRNLNNSEENFLYFDVIVLGQFEPIGVAGNANSYTTPGDVEFIDQLKNFFCYSSSSSTLIEALTNDTNEAAKYFQNAHDVTCTVAYNQISSLTFNGGEGRRGPKESMALVIVAATVSACAVIGLMVGILIQRRHNAHNDVETDESSLEKSEGQ